MNDNGNIINISIAQIDIKNKDTKSNLLKISNISKSLKGLTDILVLPETVNTGFEIGVKELHEETNGYTYNSIKEMATSNNIAIVCSFFIIENGKSFNRLHFFYPDGKVLTQDKRHLFSFANEDKYISNTKNRNIFEYNGWKIFPTICYDIRFPVWCRNRDNEYDILINISNWPKVRQEALDILLRARAVENLCYVISANRCGNDSNGFEYVGRSSIIDPKGNIITKIEDGIEDIITSKLDINELNRFREKFPVYNDADNFEINL